MLLDITHARLKHLEWELHLEEILQGRKKATTVSTHDECMLGRWLYNEGLAKHSSIPELALLEREHKAFHRLARQVLNEHKVGNHEKARETFSEVKWLSKEIIFLLTFIELAVLNKQKKYYAIRHPLKSLKGLFSKK